MKTARGVSVFLFVLTAFNLSNHSPAQDTPFPARAFQRIGTTNLRHGSRILCLAFSPDAQMLAAGGGHDPLRLWNPKTGELVREINEPWITSAVFTQSGETLVYAGYQKTVRMWSFKLGKEIGRLEGHKAAIKAIAVSHDTSAIASGSQDGLVALWDWNNKRKIIDLTGHTDEVTSLAFSPDKDNSVLASGSSDRTIRIWNIENNQVKLKFDAGCGVLALAFSPDGRTLYSAGDDNLIRRWDVPSGKQTGEFKGHEGLVVSLIAHGDTIISGSLDRTIRVWNAKTTEQKKSLPRGQGECDALAMSKDGSLLATAGLNNTIRVINAATGNDFHAADAAQAGLTTLAMSADRKRLASITSDGRVIVWNRDKGKIERQWDCKQTGDVLLGLAPKGDIVVTASNSLHIWNASDGSQIANVALKLGQAVALAFSPDGNTLALGYSTGQESPIELWDVKDRKATGVTFKYTGSLHALAWSPDGKTIAAAGAAKILLFDASDGTLSRSFDVKEGPAPAFPMVATLAFGADRNTLAAGCFDGHIRIYNLAAKNPTDPKEHRLCEGHLSVPYGLAFSTDGRTLVSGSFDKTVRLWEAFSGKQIGQLKGHVGPVMGVAFAPDGRSVYSASTDTTVLQWDVPNVAGQGKLPQVNFGAPDLDNAWFVLVTEETPRGHEMMWRCIANGPGSIAHMTKEKRYYLLDPDRVKKLFKDLDSGNFVIRTGALKELEGYGRWMEGRYDAALANPPSLEYKRRVEILKEKLNEKQSASLVQERLRLRRFMLMCEQIGGADAMEALQLLADRGPEEELRDEAKASLQRLKSR